MVYNLVWVERFISVTRLESWVVGQHSLDSANGLILLSFAMIVQIECRTTSLLDCYAEIQSIFCKDNFFHNSLQYFANKKAIFFATNLSFASIGLTSWQAGDGVWFPFLMIIYIIESLKSHLSRQGTIQIKRKSKDKSKRKNQKTNPCKDSVENQWYSVSVFWFKLCSRRLTERNAASRV